ncbi:MAG TPA: copper resistance protein CopC [Blastococcus sp.]|nr:copper resistance protein CopC [Blastococcus sp.]
MTRRIAVLLVAALLCVLATTATAQAHERLTASEPAADAVLPEVPTRVQLTFSGAVSSPTMVLRNGTGDQVSDGEPLLDGALVTLPLQESLPNGAYTVEWRVVSSDDDPVSGDFAFTVSAPVTAAPAPSASPSSSEASAAPSPADASPVGAVAEGDPSVGPWLVGGAAALALVVAGMAVRRARTRG